jgi:hypothetical protein
MGLQSPIMGASANNSLIKAFMDYYENRSFINKDGSYQMLEPKNTGVQA